MSRQVPGGVEKGKPSAVSLGFENRGGASGSIGLEAIVPNAGVAFASAANPTTAAVAPAPAMPTMSVKSFEA